MARSPAPGIRERHARSCGRNEGRRCTCTPSFEASVPAGVSGEKYRKSFPTRAAAAAWRRSSISAIEEGRLTLGKTPTVREAAEELFVGTADGSIRNRSGDPYKPSVVASYRNSLEVHVLPALGARRLGDLRVRDVQTFIDTLVRAGLNAATIRNAVMPLRVIARRALLQGDLVINPVSGVRLPAVRGTRDRFATPQEAAELIEAAPDRDRTIWATAFYAGLRRGELQGLHWDDVEFDRGVLRVRRQWDRYVHAETTPKSAAGTRSVPLTLVLQDHLLRHQAASSGGERVFAAASGQPFDPGELMVRARRAWGAAGLEPVCLHEARHSYASLMAEAGVPIEDLSEFLGHSTINLTIKTYRHLYPQARERAARALDALIAGAATERRIRQMGGT
jgi:integrase